MYTSAADLTRQLPQVTENGTIGLMLFLVITISGVTKAAAHFTFELLDHGPHPMILFIITYLITLIALMIHFCRIIPEWLYETEESHV